jgi:hypothetical protein
MRRITYSLAALIVGVGTLGQLIGGPSNGTAEGAQDCSIEHRLRVEIFDDDTGARLNDNGTEVQITPAPRVEDAATEFEDGEEGDDASGAGRIDIDEACQVTSTDEPAAYTITVQTLPGGCDLVGDDTETTTLTGNETVTFHVDDCRPGVGTAPANLGFPQADCNRSTADVTFYWGPNQAGLQFLDLSLTDNNFASGTFVNTSALNENTDRFTWTGLSSGVPHYWRINTLTDDGWVSSFTGTFVPCGTPQVRGITYSCIGGGLAAVTFSWSPATPSGSTTWLDLSIFNNGFDGGSFINAGPMGHDWLNWTWPGIMANQTHYWRVNTLLGNDWARSNTGSFVAYC